MNFQIFKLDLQKAEEPEIKFLTSVGSSKNKRVPPQNLLALLTMPKTLTVWTATQTAENSERDGNTRPPDLPLEKSVCRSGSNS